MAGRQALALLVGVRILLSQPEAPGSLTGFWGFWLGERGESLQVNDRSLRRQTPCNWTASDSVQLPILPLLRRAASRRGIDLEFLVRVWG